MIEKEHIVRIVNQLMAGTNLFLVDVKVSNVKIAVFVDTPEGITIDQCVILSRELTEYLEPTGALNTREVEVGSPGMSEPLKVYQQYLRRLGQLIIVKDSDGKEKKGRLIKANESGFTIAEFKAVKQDKKKTEQITEYDYLYNQIKEATVDFKF